MRAGKLDKEISVGRRTDVVDEYGTPRPTWTPLATLRAEVLQQSAREFFANGAASTETLAVFKTRFVAGLTSSDQITYDGKTYDITEVKEIGRRRGLELHAVSRGAD